MTLTAAFKKYERYIYALAYKYSPVPQMQGDFIEEGFLVLVKTYNYYIKGKKKGKIDKTDFKRLFVRSLTNRYINMCQRDFANYKNIHYNYKSLEMDSEDCNGDRQLDAAYNSQKDPDSEDMDEKVLSSIVAKQMIAELFLTVKEEMPPEAVELLKHMLWSQQTRVRAKIRMLRSTHLLKAGAIARIDARVFNDALGRPPLRLLSEVTGMPVQKVCVMREQIKQIAVRVWGPLPTLQNA